LQSVSSVWSRITWSGHELPGHELPEKCHFERRISDEARTDGQCVGEKTASLLGQEAVTALWKGDFLGR